MQLPRHAEWLPAVGRFCFPARTFRSTIQRKGDESSGSARTKNSLSWSSALLAICFLVLVHPAIFAAETAAPQCVLVERQGKVEIARKGSTTWTVAEPDTVLQVGDRLRTALRSRATLRWSESSVVRVDQLTSMEIQPPVKPADKPQLDLKSGATYLFSREKPTEVQFRTPVASGAIRGTEFNLAVDDNGRTVLSLIDGEVELANAQGRE